MRINLANENDKHRERNIKTQKEGDKLSCGNQYKRERQTYKGRPKCTCNGERVGKSDSRPRRNNTKTRDDGYTKTNESKSERKT